MSKASKNCNVKARWPTVLAIGASVRAVAQSIARSNRQVKAIDLFGDRDLRKHAEVYQVPMADYPGGIVELASGVSADAFVFTGGFESEPGLIRQITSSHVLAGCSAATLQRLGEIEILGEFWRSYGFAAPRFFDEHATPVRPFVTKSRRSSGGLGHSWGRPSSPRSGQYYQQEFVAGQVYGGSYLTNGRETMLLGVSKQLYGNDWRAPRPFQFVGGVGPIDLDARDYEQWRRIGQITAERFGIIGLFGIDAVQTHSSIAPLEVNARYTATMELLERASGRSFMGMHFDACAGADLPDKLTAKSYSIWGKRIHYANQAIEPSEDKLAMLLEATVDNWSRFADIPASADSISAGHPTMTSFAVGTTANEVEEQLRRQVCPLQTGVMVAET